ncbi:hypothetical protein CAOG_03354 [Capsaspora owczarzaki ATCC 30864]|uniref:Uncharacterized protein n=1 Tax=Capsaspora owczarzaki (strain ATCC 30864) TaxID=595528 RepID=A0A0D2WP55_CAPO3|nr:hypothetical protein CAOG_03354 [Capsaspora owczarzaki ATCC 30864]KJE92373.1 hypothetical protein CAOG_003354 [Capsaspora owczarzaki ATCC 30864]|eukprot:XP_004364193.1 hypothetical protein CAOG_03354 [Capsaspora owczarzaki ATCC 30864]
MLLALPGPAFVLDTVRLDNGTVLDAFALTANPNATRLPRVLLNRAQEATDLAGEHHTVRTASSIWDASLQLARCLERQHDRLDDPDLAVADKHVLELGAGSGLVGLACAAFGARSVTLTDTASVVASILEPNRQLNPALMPYVSCTALDWLHQERDRQLVPNAIDVIVAADVVWVADLVLPLVRTIRALASASTIVLLAHQTRSAQVDEVLFAALAEAGFVATPVASITMHPSYMKPGIRIVKFRLGGSVATL